MAIESTVEFTEFDAAAQRQKLQECILAAERAYFDAWMNAKAYDADLSTLNGRPDSANSQQQLDYNLGLMRQQEARINEYKAQLAALDAPATAAPD